MPWRGAAIAMRALVLLVVLLAPGAIAAGEPGLYVVTPHRGIWGDGTLAANGRTIFPEAGSRLVVELDDAKGPGAHVRVCHEWTYDDGSHPTVRCVAGCSPVVEDTLSFPPSPRDTTYRVIVDLRQGPGACAHAATAGTMRIGTA